MLKKPEFISLKNYHYSLPEEKIAKYPKAIRDLSKLLIFKDDSISSSEFTNLPDQIPQGAHLVFNETKVIHARLIFKKLTGAKIEIFCLEPILPTDYQLNFASRKKVIWKCLVGNLKKWKDETLEYSTESGYQLFAKKIDSGDSSIFVEFSWNSEEKSFSEIIEEIGSTPIPPYLNRPAEESDSINYQTVYSRNEGSVAAPTAGLHFTNKVLMELSRRQIQQTHLTLHVGAGTFIPVKSENAVDHSMHIERLYIHKSAIINLIQNSDFIIPVGTTSCRTLESLYWFGIKILLDKFDEESPLLNQWEAYSLNAGFSRSEAMNAILKYLEKSGLEVFTASTGIMITPGYEFQMTDALITNFHQPSSTLLMLISSLTGEKWKDIYTYALKNDFRFLSYGDSSLLFPSKE
ncbi:MAG: S-adenosylmethionine:tRNA ribosyltransferase-isomerase [Bacteroidales bacterium]|nr:S-adenosylmethionine:tRNA ribosyltransferase-isomerase [Bacteroidales bacterium]